MTVTPQAGINQIRVYGKSVMLFRDDVIDLEGGVVDMVRKAAILAGTLRPVPHFLCQ
jgi:hypothetical protein